LRASTATGPRRTKLEVEARKLDDERRLYLDRQLAEMRKMEAERSKLFAEALKFERERWWFPWLQLFAAIAGSAVVAAIVSRVIHGGATPSCDFSPRLEDPATGLLVQPRGRKTELHRQREVQYVDHTQSQPLRHPSHP
jgi:hypothetical protein